MINRVKKVTGYSVAGFTLIIFLGLLIFIPGVTSYAVNLPVLKSVVELVKNDTGVAGIKTDKESSLVSVSQDDYTFKVDNVLLDKEKLIITGSISGPELEYTTGGEYPADVEIVPKDFKEGSTTGVGSNKFYGRGNTFTFQIEEKYKDGEVGKFIEKGQNYLILDVMVFRQKDIEGKSVGRRLEEGYEEKRDYRAYWQENDEAIKEFKSIKVPFSYNDTK